MLLTNTITSLNTSVDELDKWLNSKPSDFITKREDNLEYEAFVDDMEYEGGFGKYSPEDEEDKDEEEALEASRDAYYDTKHPDAL